jgi:heme-degrading monooxygenase HmoA
MEHDQALYLILWEFHVKDGLESRFEEIYGPEGAWAKFFRRGDGYAGTELLRDVQRKGRYVTLDYWVSQAAYETFREQHLAEYKAIDLECESLTFAETPLGSYQVVSPARASRRGI